MTASTDSALAAQRARLFPQVLQLVGAFDILIGAAFVLFGPALVGDPSIDFVLMICGGVFALSGVGLILWGRARAAAARAGERVPTVSAP